AAQLRCKFRRAHLHPQRPLQNLRPAANESGLAGRERPATVEIAGARAARGDRRYLPLSKRSGSIGPARAPRATLRLPAPGARPPPAKPGRTRPPARRAQNLLTPESRRRLVRRPPRPCRALRRRPGHRAARHARRLHPPWPLLRFSFRRLRGRQPAHHRERLPRRNPASARGVVRGSDAMKGSHGGALLTLHLRRHRKRRRERLVVGILSQPALHRPWLPFTEVQEARIVPRMERTCWANS